MSHIFRIGDRVRVNFIENPKTHGREATIIRYGFSNNRIHGLGYYFEVDIDGIGPFNAHGDQYAYSASDLEPLSPPKSQISEILAMKDLPNRDCKIAIAGEFA